MVNLKADKNKKTNFQNLTIYKLVAGLYNSLRILLLGIH